MRPSGPVTAFSSLVGLSLEPGRLRVAVLRRSGNRLQVRRAMVAPLSLDPLANDPELVGQEIRNHLVAAGVRERRCLVCVPLKWALTACVALPDLSDEDAESYVALQAEREFPFALEDLRLSSSRHQTQDGRKGALLAAIQANSLGRLQKALKVARLRPVAATFGMLSAVGDGAQADEGKIVLFAGPEGVDLAVWAGGGFVALRPLGEMRGTEEDEKRFDAEGIVRQVRITLGQLPEDLRTTIAAVEVAGPLAMTQALVADLRQPATRIGLPVETATLASEAAAANGCGMDAMGDEEAARFAPLLCVTARRLRGRALDFEFPLATPSRLRVIGGRISSRWTAWLGSAAAALILVIGAAFLVQSWRLARLESAWKKIEPQATEAQALRDRLREYQPWFESSPEVLTIMRRLAEALPEEGSVWITSLGIDGLSDVSCSGKARENRVWLETLDRLRASDGIEDVKVLSIRDNPGEAGLLQFALQFRWNPGATDGT